MTTRKPALALIALPALLIAAIVIRSTGESGPRAQADAPAPVWTMARAMSLRRSYTASAEVGSQIYVAGGMVGETGRPLAAF